MKKIALYGGAFDPPHAGHINGVKNILAAQLVDEIWLVPSGDMRYDKKSGASARHRLAMLELVMNREFSNCPQVRIDTFQIDDSSNECAAIDLLDHYKQGFKGNIFYFVIGADNAVSLSSWKESDRLLSENKFIVLPRPGVNISGIPSMQFFLLEEKKFPLSQASSTRIRSDLTARNTSDMLPEYIKDYIGKNKLYQ